MKIGLFTDFYLPHAGGVETAVFNQAAALRAAGHEVTIVCGQYPQGGATAAEVRLPAFLGIMVNEHPAILPTRANQAIVDKLDFDVVHTHTEHGVGLLAALYAQRKNVPLFETIHTQNIVWMKMNRGPLRVRLESLLGSIWTTCETRLVGLKKHVPLQFNKEPRYERWLWKHMTSLFSYTKTVFVPSTHLLEETRRHCPSANYQLLPNGIDTNTLRPRYSNDTADKTVRILWVGRAYPEKRPLVFLEAISLLSDLNKMTINTPFEVDIIGGGTQLKEMQTFVRTRKLTSVHILDRQSPDTTREYYEKADVFAMTSTGFDNQPMVLAEAMAAGLQVVLCDPNLADQVAPEARLLVGAEAADLAAGLLKALHKKTPASAKPARAFAEAHYALPVVAAKLETVYRQALQKP